MQFNPVRLRCTPEINASWLTHSRAARLMFDIAPFKDDAAARPRMIMERAIVIVSQELVQIDVEEAISGNDMPAEQVGIVFTANYNVR
jgi:hypothetical protein